MICWTISIIVSIFWFLTIIVVRNLYIQNSKYEELIVTLDTEHVNTLELVRDDIQESVDILKELDQKEMFEKDDDVGIIFEQIISTVQNLNTKLGTYGEETEEED